MFRFISRWRRGRLFAAAPLLLMLMQGGGSGVDPNSLAVPAPFVIGDPTPNYFPDWNNTQGKRQVDCRNDGIRTTENWIVWGQSNTTDVIPTLYAPTNAGVENGNISDGGCYVPALPGGPIDPMLGCTGYPPGLGTPYPTGNWIGILADLRINAGKAQREIMWPIGVGGSYMHDWEPGGSNNIRFGATARRLAFLGITPTGILVGQGESDVFTSGAAYLASLQNAIASIRSYWPTVPIYVAQETYINGITSAAVTTAQAAVRNPANKVFAGPNLDLRGAAYRQPDNTHFNYSPGAFTVAADWNATLPRRRPRRPHRRSKCNTRSKSSNRNIPRSCPPWWSGRIARSASTKPQRRSWGTAAASNP